MALRPASFGTSYEPSKTAQYGTHKEGVKITELAPTNGSYRASSFYRAAATSNPKDAKGWRKPSPYSGTLERNEAIFVDYSDKYVFGRNSYQGGIPMYAGISAFPGCCASDLSRARNKALLELKDQSVNLSIAWRERQATIDMVTSCVRKTVAIIKGVKTYLKRPRRRKELLKQLRGKWKNAPEAWLMYRYGILPTMLDAYGAAEALQKRDNGAYDRYMCTVRGKSTTPITERKLSSLVRYIGRYYTMRAQMDQILMAGSYGARVRYDCTLTNTKYLQLSEVGLVNPLEVAWELVTFSFIADWFTSLGDWCSALDATLPFTFIGGTETIFLNWSGRTELKSSDGTVTISGGTSPGTGFKFQRSVVNGFPWPSPFVFKKDPINVVRLADALSLLASFAK